MAGSSRFGHGEQPTNAPARFACAAESLKEVCLA
jgi:hypothetical protein